MEMLLNNRDKEKHNYKSKILSLSEIIEIIIFKLPNNQAG